MTSKAKVFQAAGERSPAVIVALMLLGALSASPASADWLVTRDGERVETRGAWEVRGRKVFFVLPNGDLSSLRMAEIDIDASARATAEAASAAQEPEQAVAFPSDDRVDPANIAVPPTASREAVEVVSWSCPPADGEGGVVLSGTVRNNGDAVVAGLAFVVLVDTKGKVVATSNAQLEASALPAGQSISFQATFPDVPAFAAVRFEFQYPPETP